MDQVLMDMFDQARKVVADADRRIAEEEERCRENERERLLLELRSRVEDAFDFNSKEKTSIRTPLGCSGRRWSRRVCDQNRTGHLSARARRRQYVDASGGPGGL